MDIQARIYQVIEEKCLKQSAIAVAAGFTPKSFNALLRKRKAVRPEYIGPICAALGITPNYLFGFDEKEAV